MILRRRQGGKCVEGGAQGLEGGVFDSKSPLLREKEKNLELVASRV